MDSQTLTGGPPTGRPPQGGRAGLPEAQREIPPQGGLHGRGQPAKWQQWARCRKVPRG